MSNNNFSLDAFSGVVRLFPLPNLVMFPHVVQPLHIFESRYVEMLEDALAGDHLLATALLLPGWEHEYDGRPPIDPVVCLGKVMSHAPTKEGRYNLLLGGITRAEIVAEHTPKRSFREADVRLLDDIEPADDDPQVEILHNDLVQCFRRFLPKDAPAHQQLDEMLSKQSELGTLTDLISYSLPLELGVRQALLAECNVLDRTRLLLDQLHHEIESSISRPFPPEFSEN